MYIMEYQYNGCTNFYIMEFYVHVTFGHQQNKIDKSNGGKVTVKEMARNELRSD